MTGPLGLGFQAYYLERCTAAVALGKSPPAKVIVARELIEKGLSSGKNGGRAWGTLKGLDLASSKNGSLRETLLGVLANPSKAREVAVQLINLLKPGNEGIPGGREDLRQFAQSVLLLTHEGKFDDLLLRDIVELDQLVREEDSEDLEVAAQLSKIGMILNIF